MLPGSKFLLLRIALKEAMFLDSLSRMYMVSLETDKVYFLTTSEAIRFPDFSPDL